NVLMCNFTEYCNLSKAGSDVIVEIGSDPAAHPFELCKPLFSALHKRFLRTLSLDPLRDRVGDGTQCIKRILAQGVTREHCDHSHKMIFNQERIARKSDHTLFLRPFLVANIRVINDIISEQRSSLPRNPAYLEFSDRHFAMGSIDMCVHSRAGLKFQHIVRMIEQPDPSERSIKITYDRFRALLKNQLDWCVLGHGNAQFGAQQ